MNMNMNKVHVKRNFPNTDFFVVCKHSSMLPNYKRPTKRFLTISTPISLLGQSSSESSIETTLSIVLWLG